MKKTITLISSSLLSMIIILMLFRVSLNVSDSSPLGVYLITKFNKTYKVDEYIVYQIDKEYLKYLDKDVRKYRTIKKIKAIKGDKIKIDEYKVYINDVKVADIPYDIPLKLKGEYILKDNEYFVLSTNPRSIDSRYYGIVKKENVFGKGHLIWELKE